MQNMTRQVMTDAKGGDMNDLIKSTVSALAASPMMKNILTSLEPPTPQTGGSSSGGLPSGGKKESHRMVDIGPEPPYLKKDLRHSLNVKLVDVYKGKTKRISFTRKRIGEDGKTVKEKKEITIKILPGMQDGEVFRFEGEADQYPGNPPGDVVVTLNVIDHDVFDRREDDLFMSMDITLSEIFELRRSFRHLDGRLVYIQNAQNDILQYGHWCRKIEGEGMPILHPENGKTHGDLYITFNALLPESLDPARVSVLRGIIPPEEREVPEPNETPVDKILSPVSEEDLEFESDDSDTDDT